jgi:RNA polymerase sigma-70 factor (ECF subfamily)
MLFLDHCLVERIKQGDLKAFDELYSRYLKPIYGYVYKRVNHREDAEDITQEVFIRAFRHIKDFRGEASFATWLYLIAKNEISRFFRKRAQLKRLLKESHLYQERKSSFVEDIEREHSIFFLYQAIKSLPLRQREAVILHGLKEVSFSRVSLALGESKGATKSTYYRAIRNLRKYFKKRRLLFEQKTRAYDSSSLPISKRAKTRQRPFLREIS